jgi:hypothetical protein
MNIPTQRHNAGSGISPDSNQGSSCLSRRNMILRGAAVVAAISLPKNSVATAPLSTTHQPSKNNDGKYGNMNFDNRNTGNRAGVGGKKSWTNSNWENLEDSDLVSFMDYDLGYIDLEEKTLQPLDNPKSVNYVFGTFCKGSLRTVH